MFISIPNGVTITNADLIAANLPGSVISDGVRRGVEVSDSLSVETIGTVAAFVASPTTAQRKNASDDWILACAKIAALPPVTTPDPYAALRARLIACRDACLTDANALGGLI